MSLLRIRISTRFSVNFFKLSQLYLAMAGRPARFKNPLPIALSLVVISVLLLAMSICLCSLTVSEATINATMMKIISEMT